MSFYSRQDRHLPVRPNLDQLKHQAKDLLRAVRRGDKEAIEEFRRCHPEPSRFALNADKMPAHLTQDACAPIKLADAQLALALSYQAPSWPRLVQAAISSMQFGGMTLIPCAGSSRRIPNFWFS